MTFRVIDIAPAAALTLTASTVPETDYGAWASGTTYARGTRVISTTTHRIYESARGGNLGKNPTLKTNRYNPDTNPTGWWIDVGATNRWRVLDARLYDRASQTTSMQWTITVSQTFNAVAVMNLQAGQVQCEVLNGGTVVSTSTRVLSGSQAVKRAVFLDLAGTAGRSVRITVSGTGLQYVGEIAIGFVLDLGSALLGTSFGFASYSRNETDEYGNPVVVRRPRGARAQVQARCAASDLELTLRRLEFQDAAPAVFMAGDPNATDGVVVYGYAEAPLLTLSKPTYAEYVLDLKGIT
jgi:hypothetical protein